MVRKDGQAGEERRVRLLSLLRESSDPVKAGELAATLGVSRQVIVQDVALLRARKEPIMATPQGYVFLTPPQAVGIQQVITTKHSFGDTQKELNILVDHGVTILDVGIEHSVYGRIFRNLGIKTRIDVQRFIKQIAESDSNLLSYLTDGVHLHTLLAPNQETMDQACSALAKEGYLVD